LAEIPDPERIYANQGYFDTGTRLRPHYRVRIVFGKRYEPWVEFIEPLVAETLR
jgi:hypothetical protein